MTQLRHYDNLGTARFVTFSCYHRLALLGSRNARDLFVLHLNRFRKHTGIKIIGYVIMPEHVHLVLLPSKGTSLGREIGKLKGSAARDLLKIVRDARSDSYVMGQRRNIEHFSSVAVMITIVADAKRQLKK